MVDGRIYRAAFIPALFAVVFAMFSLKPQPLGRTTPLAPDAFDSVRAEHSYRVLAAQLPDRRPGSSGGRLAADRVYNRFRGLGYATSRQQFSGTVDGRNVKMQNVVGVLPGNSDRRIVLIAHRDGRSAEPSADGAAPTAVMLELAALFKRLAHNKTIVAISTDGGTAGAAGARNLADGHLPQGAGVDGALAIDNVVGAPRDSEVLSWAAAPQLSSRKLVRTGQRALHAEIADVDTGGLLDQLFRQAVPITLTEQGPLVASGFGAVTLAVTGEVPRRGGTQDASLAAANIGAVGKATLATALVLDSDRAPSAATSSYLNIFGQTLPEWIVRILVIAFLLPVLVIGIDSFARAGRRRERPGQGLLWVLTACIPFVAILFYAYVFDWVDFLPNVPSYPFNPHQHQLDFVGVLALVTLAAIFAVSWFLVQRLLRRRYYRALAEQPDNIAAASGLTLVLGVGTLALWVLNPYAAALLLPAAHLWAIATLPEGSRPLPVSATLLALGFVPLLFVFLYYAAVLRLGVGIVFYMLLLVSGGYATVWVALLMCAVAGAFTSAVAIVWTKRGGRERAVDIQTRGPKSYAGPGSLGGTDSALRRS